MDVGERPQFTRSLERTAATVPLPETKFMQPEKIVLFPPTHEQSTPSFHVEGSMEAEFLTFLKSHGVEIAQPPEKLPKAGPDALDLSEIRAQTNTPIEMLEGLLKEFLAERI